MDPHDPEHHDSPPRTIREVLGMSTFVTGLATLGLWLAAAGYAVVVIVLVGVDGDSSAVSFAVMEMGAALVVLAALGMFATLSVFLVTLAIRTVRPSRVSAPDSDASDWTAGPDRGDQPVGTDDSSGSHGAIASRLVISPGEGNNHLRPQPMIDREESPVKYGPVDVVVLASGEPKFDGSVLADLESLVKGGTIRVLDAMILAKADDGTRITMDMEDLDPEDQAALGFVETGTRGLFDSEDADVLWEGMVPGSAVVALAIENTWAVKVINDLMNVGVDLAMSWRIPAPIIEDAMASLGQ